MDYTLTSPCKNCPFRTDVKPYLTLARAASIANSVADGATFSCHNTNEFDDDGEASKEGQHCAGALIMLEKMEQPNQMMRISERLGLYDRRKLKMDAPVFDSPEEMIDANERFQCPKRKKK
jgi:hypothetical protein